LESQNLYAEEGKRARRRLWSGAWRLQTPLSRKSFHTLNVKRVDATAARSFVFSITTGCLLGNSRAEGRPRNRKNAEDCHAHGEKSPHRLPQSSAGGENMRHVRSRILGTALAMLVLIASAYANSSVDFLPGNHPQPGEQNLLFNSLTNGRPHHLSTY
jgi:hypothetical protein